MNDIIIYTRLSHKQLSLWGNSARGGVWFLLPFEGLQRITLDPAKELRRRPKDKSQEEYLHKGRESAASPQAAPLIHKLKVHIMKYVSGWWRFNYRRWASQPYAATRTSLPVLARAGDGWTPLGDLAPLHLLFPSFDGLTCQDVNICHLTFRGVGAGPDTAAQRPRSLNRKAEDAEERCFEHEGERCLDDRRLTKSFGSAPRQDLISWWRSVCCFLFFFGYACLFPVDILQLGFVLMSFQTSQTPGLEPHLTRGDHNACFVKPAEGNFLIF